MLVWDGCVLRELRRILQKFRSFEDQRRRLDHSSFHAPCVPALWTGALARRRSGRARRRDRGLIARGHAHPNRRAPRPIVTLHRSISAPRLERPAAHEEILLL